MALKDDVITRIDLLITKADQVLATYHPPSSRRSESSRKHSRPGYVDAGVFVEWRSQSRAFLINLVGPTHPYVQEFEVRVSQPDRDPVEMGQGILRAVKSDLEAGFLQKIKLLVEAELFSDFLDMAEHLLQTGYYSPAASLAGAVLEDGLRKIATVHNLNIGASINALNQELYGAKIYNILVMRKVQVWGDTRNKADHGRFDEFTTDDVRDMVKGISSFLADYLT